MRAADCCCCWLLAACCCWPSGEICHFLHNKIYLSSSCPLPFGGVDVAVVGSRIASNVAALKTLTAHLLVVRTWLPMPSPSTALLLLLLLLEHELELLGGVLQALCLGLKSITAVVVITPKDLPCFAGRRCSNCLVLIRS